MGTTTGCGAGFIASSGPNRKEVLNAPNTPQAAGVQLVDITGLVASKLLADQKRSLFSELFSDVDDSDYVIGAGDFVEVSVWEAAPGTLFGTSVVDERTSSTTVRGTTIPEQMVSSKGYITVPFAGRIRAADRTPHQVEAEITKRLAGMAHQPQVLVRLVRNTSTNVTVVGEVANSARMPLTPRKEKLLDALAAAGGVKQPVSKIMLQVTRGDKYHALPLEAIIRDPNQNIVLQRGDVITALYQPLSFTVLGATGKNEEVNFEAQGISLAQALARAGGLQDNRADSLGVFIFRFEPANCMDWPVKPVMATPAGRVPVIYRANLKDPATFFAAQEFPIKDKDLLYVSTASSVELQKFLNLVFTVVYPTMSLINLIAP